MRKRRFLFIALLLSFLILFSGLGKEATEMAAVTITSTAFENNGNIPVKYTCDGDDVNPPLIIKDIPPGTESIALIADDPDAPMGTWVHWVVWNIPPDTREIGEDSVPSGAQQGINDFRKHDYGGPCPPSGTHRYFFKAYALDRALDLSENSRKEDLEKAMKGHVLAEALIIGLYKRK